MGSANYPLYVDNYAALFNLADRMLYRAKNRGKNRYVMYNPDIHGKIVDGMLKEENKVVQDTSPQDKMKLMLNCIEGNQIYASALRGVGDATMPTVIMLISFVAFRQVYLAVTKALGAGFVAVALAYPVGWILCSTLLIIRYSRSALVTGKMPDPD